MSLLYNKKHKKIDTFIFNINSGGEDLVKETGEVSIIFLNGKFDQCNFPFTGHYTRNGFRILAEINDKISELEEELKPRK